MIGTTTSGRSWLLTATAFLLATGVSLSAAMWGHDVFVAPSIVVAGLSTVLLSRVVGATIAILMPAAALLSADPVFGIPIFDSAAWIRVLWVAPLGLLVVWLSDMLKAAYLETSRLAEDRKDLMSVAFHELSSPLTAALGTAQIGSRNATDRRTSALFEEIARDCMGMRRTLELFLNASRIDRLALHPEFEEVDLAEVLVTTVNTAKVLHPHASIACSIADFEATTLITDQYMLREIVLNLVDNAAKYSGEAPRIVVSMRSQDGTTRIIVHDNGPGIPVQERNQIFRRFQRGSTAKGTGSGLGLFIVQQLTRAVGGRIALLDSSPKGSVFQLEVPLVPRRQTDYRLAAFHK